MQRSSWPRRGVIFEEKETRKGEEEKREGEEESEQREREDWAGNRARERGSWRDEIMVRLTRISLLVVHAFLNTNMLSHTRTQIHIYACVWMCTHTHTYMQMCVYTYIHTYIYTYTHIDTHTYVYVYVCLHISSETFHQHCFFLKISIYLDNFPKNTISCRFHPDWIRLQVHNYINWMICCSHFARLKVMEFYEASNNCQSKKKLKYEFGSKSSRCNAQCSRYEPKSQASVAGVSEWALGDKYESDITKANPDYNRETL